MQLRFGPQAARVLVREQGLDSPQRLRVITDKNVDDICNIMRKSGGKNANRMPNSYSPRKPAASCLPISHWWRCTFDWEVMGVQEDIVHLLTRLKKLKDKYTDPDMLPKANKANMA